MRRRGRGRERDTGWTAVRIGAVAAVVLLTPVAQGSPAAAQIASLEGTWAVTMATSVQRTRETLEVLKEIEAELVLTDEADGMRGTLTGEADGLGPFVVHLEGAFRDGELALDPVRAEGSDLPGEFAGFYVRGAPAEGRLAGEMWSVMMRGGEERHLGPLPWRGERRN